MPDRRATSAALRSAAVVGLAVGYDLIVWQGDRELRDHRLLPWAVVPVVTVLAHSTLLARRRRPRAVFAVEWTFALVASLAVPEFQPCAGLLFALYALASRRPSRESALWLLGVAAPFVLQSHNTTSAAVGDRARASRC